MPFAVLILYITQKLEGREKSGNGERGEDSDSENEEYFQLMKDLGYEGNDTTRKA